MGYRSQWAGLYDGRRHPTCRRCGFSVALRPPAYRRACPWNHSHAGEYAPDDPEWGTARDPLWRKFHAAANWVALTVARTVRSLRAKARRVGATYRAPYGHCGRCRRVHVPGFMYRARDGRVRCAVCMAATPNDVAAYTLVDVAPMPRALRVWRALAS